MPAINPKSRKVITLRNDKWSITAEVRREHDRSYTVNVYSDGEFKHSHIRANIRQAIISACDIVGEP